jgi:hypothetical protein
VLKDSVKEMYQGPLTVFGNPYIKPYDFLAISDGMSNLSGLAETKTVTHTMSIENGFVTSVAPDCLASYADFEGQDLLAWLQVTTGHMLVALWTATFIGMAARSISPAIMLRGMRRLHSFFKDSVRNAKDGKALGVAVADVKAARDAIGDQLHELTKAVKSGNSLKIKEILEASLDDAAVKPLAGKIPFAIKTEIETQRLLRGVPGTGVGQTVKGLADKVQTSVKNKAGEFVFNKDSRLNTKITDLSKQLTEAETRLKAFNKTPEEISEVRKALITRGKKLADMDQALVAAVKDTDAARLGLKAATTTSTTLGKIPGATANLKALVKGALSKSALLNTGTQLLNIAIGGLADYVVRWAISRQCLVLYPLKVGGKNFEAGINGHRGAVSGDDLGLVDTFVQNIIDYYKGGWVGSFIPIIGDVLNEGVTYRHSKVPPIFRQ